MKRWTDFLRALNYPLGPHIIPIPVSITELLWISLWWHTIVSDFSILQSKNNSKARTGFALLAPYTIILETNTCLANEDGKLLWYSSSLWKDAPSSKSLAFILCYVQTMEKSYTKTFLTMMTKSNDRVINHGQSSTKLEPQLHIFSQASNSFLLGTVLDIYLRRNTFSKYLQIQKDKENDIKHISDLGAPYFKARVRGGKMWGVYSSRAHQAGLLS